MEGGDEVGEQETMRHTPQDTRPAGGPEQSRLEPAPRALTTSVIDRPGAGVPIADGRQPLPVEVVGVDGARPATTPANRWPTWLLLAVVAVVGLALVVAGGAGWVRHEGQLSAFRAELEVQAASIGAQAVQLDAQVSALGAQAADLGAHTTDRGAESAELEALEDDLDNLYWFVDELSMRQQNLEHIVRQTPDFDVVEEMLRDSVVQVETEFGQGSGFRLDLAPGCFDPDCDVYEAEGYDTAILTNYHVIAEVIGMDYEDRVVTVIGPDGAHTEGRVWYWDEWNDLALIDLDRSDFDRYLEALVWAPEDSVNIGDRVAIGGHPLGREFVMTTGSLTGDRVGEWQTDAIISGGSSGSPMVDSFGRVVGVAAESLGGITSAVDIYALCDVLVDC